MSKLCMEQIQLFLLSYVCISTFTQFLIFQTFKVILRMLHNDIWKLTVNMCIHIQRTVNISIDWILLQQYAATSNLMIENSLIEFCIVEYWKPLPTYTLTIQGVFPPTNTTSKWYQGFPYPPTRPQNDLRCFYTHPRCLKTTWGGNLLLALDGRLRILSSYS